MESAIWTFGGTLAGALITFLVSRYYYQRAGKELRQEAQELSKLSRMILRYLEAKGEADILRDESGNPTALGFTVSVGDSIQTSSHALSGELREASPKVVEQARRQQ